MVLKKKKRKRGEKSKRKKKKKSGDEARGECGISSLLKRSNPNIQYPNRYEKSNPKQSNNK